MQSRVRAHLGSLSERQDNSTADACQKKKIGHGRVSVHEKKILGYSRVEVCAKKIGSRVTR